MKESILSSAVRAFFVTLLGVLGFCVALFLLAIVIGGITTKASNEPSSEFTVEVAPNANGKRESLGSEPVILKINIDGIIGLDGLDQSSIRRMLVESREGVLKDNLVKAVLLHLQTPGGTVVDADGIYRALKAYKKQYDVPVYAYVDGMCASGGMYIAAAADKVLASDVSIVGSIGVIAPSTLNISQLLDKIGVQSLTLYAGKGKDDLNPLRPWQPGEADNYKHLIDYYYNDFVDIMVEGRPELNREKLVQEYGAKIFPAIKGKEIGYVDETGVSLRSAINQLVEKMGVKDDNYRVVEMSKHTWYSELFKSQLNLLQGKIKHEFPLPLEMNPQLSHQFLYLFKP